jgi:hypothetical protein
MADQKDEQTPASVSEKIDALRNVEQGELDNELLEDVAGGARSAIDHTDTSHTDTSHTDTTHTDSPDLA